VDCNPKKKKKKKKEKGKKKITYVCVANTDKDCDMLQDRHVLSSGRMPHKKKAPVLTTAKIWS
jgi:hypothetical protein